jgi:hypothetical protein
MNGSAAPDKYDPWVAGIILALVLIGGLIDVLLFAFLGQPYTISAFLRRVFVSYPTILSIVSFALGALFAHIMFSK